MDAELLKLLQDLSNECDWCNELQDGPCAHCRDKQLLISVACAWAFDLGLSGG